MRTGGRTALSLAVGFAVAVGIVIAPASASIADASSRACASGGSRVPVGAEYWSEVPYVDLIELCVFPNGSATVQNNTDQVWNFTGPGSVKMWKGDDKIGGMHRLTEVNEPSARFMLPDERVALPVLRA